MRMSLEECLNNLEFSSETKKAHAEVLVIIAKAAGITLEELKEGLKE